MGGIAGKSSQGKAIASSVVLFISLVILFIWGWLINH